MARALITTPVLLMLFMGAALAQGDTSGLRGRLEKRFTILPIANGLVLTPRFRTDVRSIEVTDAAIAIDGAPVTGAELRKRVGADADLILQLSYLDESARRSLAGVEGRSIPPPAESPQRRDPPRDSDAVSPNAVDDSQPARRARHRDDIVRIGGSVSVDADESIDGDVVVIGGSARVDGQVDGELVVVGGSALLGPKADIRKDVTVVGGALSRDPQATIRGSVKEVGIGEIAWGGGEWMKRGDWNWNPMQGFYPVARLTGTLVRVALLLLLASLVLFVAPTPVEQIADRVASDPLKSWIVGFLAQILFVPVLVMTVVVLAISIIGIPLLLLVPVAIFAGIVALLVGFTGVAYHLGRLLQQKMEALRARPYAATSAGIVAILSPLLLARLVGLTGLIGDFGFIVGILVAVGVLLEYVVWTAGLGAAALARFSRPAPPTVTAHPPMIAT